MPCFCSAKRGMGESITTDIVAASDFQGSIVPFYYAEDYHQQYLAKPGARRKILRKTEFGMDYFSWKERIHDSLHGNIEDFLVLCLTKALDQVHRSIEATAGELWQMNVESQALLQCSTVAGTVRCCWVKRCEKCFTTSFNASSTTWYSQSVPTCTSAHASFCSWM